MFFVSFFYSLCERRNQIKHHHGIKAFD